MPAVLQCIQCSSERRVTNQQLLELVQSHGMLRRESKPELELVLELMGTIIAKVSCDQCGGIGVLLQDDWPDDWSTEVLCDGCKAIIPAERLEIFPDTRFCPTCQSSHESGVTPGEEVEYCLRCGGMMKLMKRGGAGLTGYTSVCSDCGKRG